MKIGPLAKAGRSMADGDPDVETILERADKNIRGEVFYTGLLAAVAISIIIVFLLITLINLTLLSGLVLPIRLVIWIVVPPLIGAFTYAIYNMIPRNRIGERKKDIDKNLSYATNYMAAMASADVTPSSIFRGLAQQDIYGEIKMESEKIARDIDFFGKDLIKVLQKAISRSPSEKFQDFLQGIITTANSGGSLKVYFMSKSEQYMKENRLTQERDLQTLGVMAESFVTVVVAAPLFLIIMMSTMAMMGQSGGDLLLAATIFGLIPTAQIVFAVLIGDTGGGD
jgi:flagellar protein FlaJ